MRLIYRFFLVLMAILWAVTSSTSLASQETFSAPLNPLTAPTPTPFITPSASTEPLFTVRMHPDGRLFVGDQISFEISSQPNTSLSVSETREVQVQVSSYGFENGFVSEAPKSLISPPQVNIGTATFTQNSNPRQLAATLQWSWNTRTFAPGLYRLTFTTAPVVYTWSQIVELLSPDQLPGAEKGAHWATVVTNCCILNYITGTAAARDIQALQKTAEADAQNAAEVMHTQYHTAPSAGGTPTPGSTPAPPKIIINLIPRTLGQGGFATNQVYISYLDRNYAGSTFGQVLHHEMIHIVDGQLGGDLRPTLFVEGLAVYMSGGHFKPEPITPRTAAALALGKYLPLKPLFDTFYDSQHEIGYMEGASLIDYMIKTYGWDQFSAFYRDIHPASDRTQSSAVDTALQKHFKISLADLESHFIQYLKSQKVTDALKQDVEGTVDYYDTVRRYEQLLDPSAFFRHVWLPNADEMRKRGIVGDYLRHPEQPINLTLENLLVKADQQLRSAQYAQLNQTLAQVNEALDPYDSSSPTIWVLAKQTVIQSR
jgi:hypothetical protein